MPERFQLLRQLGSGGMGTVWLAQDSQNGSLMAMKLLHGHLANDRDYVRRLQNEVRLVERIASSRVAQIYGYGRRDGVPYLAMEYVPGESLKENIRTRGPFTWQEAKPVLRQAAEGLAAAHAAGVIHQDIKPSNILVTPNGGVKLADFGISRALDASRHTRGSTMMGTPAYMAPETQKDALSDLYALGCVLFEMLTGQQPVSGTTPQDVMLGHLLREPNLSLIPDGQARRVTGWLLQKDPHKRPASAAALIGALDGTTRVPGGTLRTQGRPRPTAAVLLVPVAGLALLGGVAIGYFSSRGGDGSDNSNGPAGATSTPEASTVATVSPTSPTRTQTATASSTSSTTTGVTLTATAVPTSTPQHTATPTSSQGGGQPPAAPPGPASTSTPVPATPTRTATPAATSTSTPTPTPSPTRTPSPTATPQPNYFLDVWFDKYQYAEGETMTTCYDLTPHVPFRFIFWKSVNGGPRQEVVNFNDDGYGGCIQTVMGNEGFREYTFEAVINGVVVAYRIGHAQVGIGNTTVTSIE